MTNNMSNQDSQNLAIMLGELKGLVKAGNEKLEDHIKKSDRLIEEMAVKITALEIWRATIIAKWGLVVGVAAFAWTFVWAILQEKFKNFL